ncbi:hypothetical protein [uncultured Psychroserpens sp.]|uniref:hypothetical protein n=1 Tax=uncultured Psychroserpens sp. TaxID=255436 RepID=UPI002624F42D|nr:hypothetical protein [uncultured Psychroserpens sp.]
MRLYIFEDNPDQAQFMVAELKERKPEYDIVVFPSLNNYHKRKEKEIINYEGEKSYLVDKSLRKGGKDRDGLVAIEDIRTIDHEYSPVIAYSATANYREEAIRAGADRFCEKTPKEEEYKAMHDYIIDIIVSISKRNSENKKRIVKTTFEAIVSGFNKDKETVSLRIQNPKKSEDFVYKDVHAKRLGGIEGIKVNQVFRVVKIVSQDGRDIRLKFENTGETKKESELFSKFDENIGNSFDEVYKKYNEERNKRKN